MITWVLSWFEAIYDLIEERWGTVAAWLVCLMLLAGMIVGVGVLFAR